MKKSIIITLIALFALTACGKKGPPIYQEKKTSIKIIKSLV